MAKASRKKSIVADELIDSLMEDLKGVISEEDALSLQESDGILSSNEEFDDSNSTMGALNLLAPEENKITGVLQVPEDWNGLDAKPIQLDSLEKAYNGKSVEELMEEIRAPRFPDSQEVEKEQQQQTKSEIVAAEEPTSSDDSYSTVAENSIFKNFQEPVNDQITRPIPMESDRTAALATADPDKTIAESGFVGVRIGRRSAPEERVSIGSLRGSKVSNVLTNIDASLVQSENLKLAQSRILELEEELEKLREENDELANAAEIVKNRAEEAHSKLVSLEKDKLEQAESYQSELVILKGSMQYREAELSKAKLKIEELENRLKNDFKKIRVRERELENRLELARAEKTALIRSKDDYILDLKRKVDQLQSELDNYRTKVIDLNKTIESNQEQFKRTVRALRLALSNLETKEDPIVPLKKAE